MVDRDIPEEMVEKATFWNERVGRVEPTREGQPLRWWYGPLKASSDPNQKWCHDCYGVVEESDGRRRCLLCKASQPLLADAIEAAADAVTRELAPTWVRYPVGIRSVPDLRVLIGQVLSAALAGRQVVDLPQRSVIDKDDVTFPGCTTNNPDLCACGSWEPLTCDACGEEFKAGDEIYLHTTKGVPFLPDAHSDQEWTHWTWHVTCDELAAGSGSGED